jgi:hypothetical protein
MIDRALGLLGTIAAAAVLSGCYAQVEDNDVSYSLSNVCGTGSGCSGNGAPLTLTSNFVPAVSINLGDSGLLTRGVSREGPLTFNGSLVLYQATLAMTTSGNFSGVSTVELRAAIANDSCAALSPTCKAIATYDAARDGPATDKLILKGSDVNLLDVTGGTSVLNMLGRGTGNAPAVARWNASLELGMRIKSRATFP